MKEVRLQNLTKKFGSLVAVAEFSLEVARGEYCFLLGPSGCGKTTILRMIAGHEEPTCGEIHIRGEFVNELPPAARNTATVFQDFALFPHKSVIENVAFGLKMRGMPKKERNERAREMLYQVGLEAFGDRKPGELSGGQKQRVALARSLVIEPAVLLLDEPIGSLDALLRVRMRAELKKLQRRLGITFIHVTHDQEEALSMADRIVVMNKGRIEQIGPPYEIYTRPRTPFVASFMGDNNILKGEVVQCKGDGLVVENGLGRFLLHHRTLETALGEEVAFSIRADLMRVLTEKDPQRTGKSQNSLCGKVTFVEYLGDIVRLRLALEDATEFVAKLPVERYFKASYREGDRVFLCWDPDSIVLLSQSGELDDDKPNGPAEQYQGT